MGALVGTRYDGECVGAICRCNGHTEMWDGSGWYAWVRCMSAMGELGGAMMGADMYGW